MAGKIHRNSLKPGHKVLWYEIKEILGQGGFGITYLAYDPNLEKHVAIKEYLPIELAVREADFSVHPVSDDRGKQYKWGLDKFIAEARTLSKFNHPNIVRVHSVTEENNTAYMVMAYEHGQTLQEILKGKKTLEEAELLKILIPILGGLEHIHSAGFIHRDIKPDNIFIRNDGSPVLLDFGSARQALGEQTKTLTSLVSPGYAPFEQYFSKSDEQGEWTDIYGLGATLYRAIAGVAPQDAVDRSSAILKTSKDIIVSAVEIGEGKYSERFLNAIDHALIFKPEDRPQSIATWSNEFEPPSSEALTVIPTDNRVRDKKQPTPLRKRFLPVFLGATVAIIMAFYIGNQFLHDKTDDTVSVDYKDVDSPKVIMAQKDPILDDIDTVPTDAIVMGEETEIDELKLQPWANAAVAATALNTGKLTESSTILQAALKEFPDHPEVDAFRASLEASTTKANEAFSSYQAEKDGAGTDYKQLRTAKKLLSRAQSFWIDNPDFVFAETGLDELIAANKPAAKMVIAKEVVDLEAVATAESGAAPIEWKPTDSGRGCEKRLAGFGKRAKAICYDFVNTGWRGPLMVVMPTGGGFNSNFAISKYEISVGDYGKYCAISKACTPEKNKEKFNNPITNISLADAKAYAAWVSESTGKSYRLPTTSEWEYVANAGGKQPKKDYNCRVALGEKVIKGTGIASIKSGQSNGWGLKNYIGNVQEWVINDSGEVMAARGYQQSFDGSASFGVDYEIIIKSSGAQKSLEDFSAEVRNTRLRKTYIASLPDIKNMKEGTIVLNIMNMETGYLIWIGYAEAVVVEKKNREELIDQAISQMIAEFPPN